MERIVDLAPVCVILQPDRLVVSLLVLSLLLPLIAGGYRVQLGARVIVGFIFRWLLIRTDIRGGGTVHLQAHGSPETRGRCEVRSLGDDDCDSRRAFSRGRVIKRRRRDGERESARLRLRHLPPARFTPPIKRHSLVRAAWKSA